MDLRTEIRSDLLFFGTCGFVVGVLTVLQFWLSQQGFDLDQTWAEELFEDFIPFKAFAFVLLNLLGLSAMASISKSLGFPLKYLEQMVSHTTVRLRQITSAITCVSVGLAAFSIIHSVATCSWDGVRFTSIVVCFLFIIFIGYFAIILVVVQRIRPFDQWPGATVMLILVLGTEMYFVRFGAN